MVDGHEDRPRHLAGELIGTNDEGPPARPPLRAWEGEKDGAFPHRLHIES
jgi:hypothetical protein